MIVNHFIRFIFKLFDEEFDSLVFFTFAFYECYISFKLN